MSSHTYMILLHIYGTVFELNLKYSFKISKYVDKSVMCVILGFRSQTECPSVSFVCMSRFLFA